MKLKKSEICNNQSRNRKEAANKICTKVAEIYAWLNCQTASFATDCSACGKCCNFASFGHKLYITSPELLYFYENLKPLKMMNSGCCPYLEDKKCTARNFRFAGCRIFFCKANAQLQSSISEQAIGKFKKLCDENNFPYQYTELSQALKNIESFIGLKA